MSKASRLARPSASSIGAGSRLPSPRKESTGRVRVLSVGEKLMRAGSDGILSRQKSLKVAGTQDKAQSETQAEAPRQNPGEKGQHMEMLPPKSKISPPKASSQQQGSMHKQTKSNLKVTSPEDGQHVSRRQVPPNGTKGDAKGSRTVPRRHTLGGARGSREILAMQPPEMDKKREAFLEHLKQKYPHHASAIMGHQERLREQSRSPKHGPSSVGEADHLSLASLESLDTMSEADSPTNFTRGSRVRASLPVVRSTNQTRDRSLGVLYLQYGDETKQIRMPNEITGIDTIRALFVSAFAAQLNMKMLESPSVAVYVKDDMRNVYYELTDVRNITDHSCLKVYHKDPAQAFSHGPRPANGDARMHSEMVHAGRDGPHPLRQPPMGPPPHHPMQGALPSTPHSMPPSPSRIPFGPRQGPIPGSATIPRERLPNASPRSISPCPSAILERRDVKPDEDRGGKSHSLSRGNEGLYADPYLLQDGRMAHGSHPNPGSDVPDHGMGGFHRASIRSTGSYSGPSPTDSMEHPSLYRQKSRNSQLPTLGSKTPPPSPHRMAEVRMIDIHGGHPHGPPPHGMPIHGMPPHGMPPHGMPPHGMPPHGMPPHGMPPHGVPPHGVPPHGMPPHGMPPHGVPPHGVPPHGVPMERSSPVRQSFRKEEVSGTKPRNNMGSPVVSDIQGHLQGPIPPANEHHTRVRMKAMEQQIASLTGLVQHALLKEPNTSGSKELLSERPSKTSSPAHSAHSSGGSPVLAPKSGASPSNRSPVPIKVNLLQFRKNVSDLRMQLHQMRQQQLQNQEALRVQLRRAEQEISVKLAEAMRGLEDPVQRQRALVEEDRHKYLGLEERVLSQLGDLEQYVGSLQNDSAAAAQRVVTMKDVEEGAVTLRKVGESLAGLKGEFPSLQTRMRSVLRVEVDAVKFLKEEPHKLDSMLKRVKSLTDTLSGLRRCASEGSQKGPSPSPSVPVEASPSAAAPAEPLEPQSSTIKSEVMPSSPVIIHHVQSSPVLIQQSQQSAALTAQPSPPLTPSPSHTPSPIPGKSQGRESPKGAASDPPSPARLKKTRGNPVNNGNGPTSPGFVIEELQNSQGKNKSRAVSIEAAEKEWEERRQNMGHYDGKEFEKILLEAQANMMKGIPSLEVEENQALPPTAAAEPADTPNPVESPTEELQSQPDKLEKKAPEKLPKPVMEKPGKPALETPPKTAAKPASPDSFTTKQGGERTSKSPPPPPPPRKTFSPSSSSGMTTTRSGEVVYTSRRDSVSAQEGEEDTPPPSPQPRPNKVAPETKPKPATPPPVTVPTEEEDEGEKIMAELQVFQMCTVKDVGVKHLVEPTSRIDPQIRELRPLLPLKEKKQSSESTREDKDPDTDENGNTTLRQSQGVIYYVTGQIPKEHPTVSGTEEIHEHRETAQPPSQIPLQNTSVASPTSRMPVPLSAKSRQSPGTTDKAGKPQKLQDAQRQFRQANGSAKRVGGDHKTTSPTIPTSKIPAFYPSSPKGSPQSAPNSDATNPINPSSSSSATKSSILSSPLPRSGSQPSSHIPSLSNGSLKLPSQHTGKTLSFSSQNGRVHSSSSSSSFSSSSSSPSPLSPTPLGPGGKSIRTIHTPSFTSYRAHNGSSNGKSCIPTATAAKDAS
ncbi:sickle tail protein homolog isoform X14 [Gymnodraco acuticeps]|uniref:Sickle tail protein homolog isoform X14 n=1 Tax=Gymnodraco acuticeps TaxID=8218 RepID=A0A6P8SSK1_GYMAC|nr:sickle tail protein homolog isoform X14 [Gymnodraco acuticeps]